MVDAEQVSEIKPAIVLRIPPGEQEVGGAARLPGIGRRQIEKPVEGLDDRLAHLRILSVKRWPRQGRGHDSSIFVGEKQRQHAGGDVGICRVRRSVCQRAIIIIDLPVQGLARELEAAEITLPMRIDVGTKGVIVAHGRSAEPTSELQSLMRSSYAVF